MGTASGYRVTFGHLGETLHSKIYYYMHIFSSGLSFNIVSSRADSYIQSKVVFSNGKQRSKGPSASKYAS